MKSGVSAVVVALVALSFVATAHAGNGYAYESSIAVPQRQVSPADPGQAIFHSKVRFAAASSICLYVWFDPTDPLDPGDELRFTPNSWFDTNPYASGPGYMNVGADPQTFRALCVVNYPGYPLDPFIAEFLDGHQVFKLTTSAGSVAIERIDVEIVGTTS